MAECWQGSCPRPLPPTFSPAPVPSLSDTAIPQTCILIHIQSCLQLGAMFCLLFSDCLGITSVLKSPCCLPILPPPFLLGLHTGYTVNRKALLLVAKPFPSQVWVFNWPPQTFLVSLNLGSVLASAARENKRDTHFKSYSSIPTLLTSGTKQVFSAGSKPLCPSASQLSGPQGNKTRLGRRRSRGQPSASCCPHELSAKTSACRGFKFWKLFYFQKSACVWGRYL